MKPAMGEDKNVKNDAALSVPRLIGYGYLVVLLFLVIFLLSVVEIGRVSPGLNSPHWALLIGVVLVLPLLLPGVKYVAPYVKSLKISDFELSFRQVEIVSSPLTALAEKLKPSAEQVNAPEYASMMISDSSVIIDAIKKVKTTGDEVMVVDLREGNAWIPPNLYFLASLAAARTSVRQIAFVETRHETEEVFVGMCFPEELQEALAKEFPVLQQAADQSNYLHLPLDKTIGSRFFKALQDLYAKSAQPSPRDTRLNASTLFMLAGQSLHRDWIEAKELLTEEDYRKILRSDYPYTAVLKDEQLESLLSRDRVALVVARDLVARSAR